MSACINVCMYTCTHMHVSVQACMRRREEESGENKTTKGLPTPMTCTRRHFHATFECVIWGLTCCSTLALQPPTNQPETVKSMNRRRIRVNSGGGALPLSLRFWLGDLLHNCLLCWSPKGPHSAMCKKAQVACVS